MAAPSVNSGHTTYTSNTVLLHPIPAPVYVPDSIIYIAIAHDGNQMLMPPAGFTTVISNLAINSSDHTATFALFRKPAAVDDPSTFTVTSSGAERAAAVAWSVSDDNGVDVVGTDDGDSNTISCPSVMTTEDDTMVFRIGAADTDTLPHGTIGGYTKLAEVERSSGATVSVQYKTQASAGDTGAENFSMGEVNEWVGITVAVKGTGGGGGFKAAWAIGTNKLIGAF